MKKSIYLTLGAAAVMTLATLSSCTQEMLDTASSELEFVAYTPTAETKTVFDAELNVLWSEGDEIAIFPGSHLSRRYRITSGAGTTSGSFEQITGADDGGRIEWDCNIAWYPYNISAIAWRRYETLVMSLQLPATQDYAQNSFGLGANGMIAITTGLDDTELHFKNVLSALMVQLKGDATITKIEVTSNDGQALCGDATITPKVVGNPTIEMEGTGSTVTLKCGDGVALNASTPTSFIITLPPVTLPQGFTLKVYGNKGKYMEKSINSSVTFARAQVRPTATITYEANKTDYNGHEYVDLGLPSGLLWATCNVGADRPEHYGGYFAWGQPEERNSFLDYQNPWYNTWSEDLQKMGVLDGNYNLTPEYDAASFNWGRGWRMPTYYEMKELKDHCNWEWTTLNGFTGYKVTGSNGNSMFMPAAGYYQYFAQLEKGGEYGTYWCSTTFSNNMHFAFHLYFYSSVVEVDYASRYFGYPVRAVTTK